MNASKYHHRFIIFTVANVDATKMSVPGASTDDIHNHAKVVLKNAVNKLGITKSSLISIEKIFPHAIGHHLGMDTHDVQAYSGLALL